MTTTPARTPHDVVTYELTTPAAIEQGLLDLVERCNALPQSKQQQLRQIMVIHPELGLTTVSFLLLMFENSDDDGNITDPAINQLIQEAQAADTAHVPTDPKGPTP